MMKIILKLLKNMVLIPIILIYVIYLKYYILLLLVVILIGIVCCPFHGEEHASLMVYRDYFICRSCGVQGGIYNLVKLGVVSWEDLKKIYS